jgi:hypothetical protein
LTFQRHQRQNSRIKKQYEASFLCLSIVNQSALIASESRAQLRKCARTKASADPDAPFEQLTDAQIRDLAKSFPWAVYAGPSNRSAAGKAQHLWRCSICEEAGSDRIVRKWIHANDFKHHTSESKGLKASHIAEAAQATWQ